MRKRIDVLKGIGQVYEGEVAVGNFPYELSIFQDMVGPDHDIPGLKSITGRIDIDFNTIMRLMMGDQKNLKLCLDDGRQMAFFFTRNDGTITASGVLQ